MMLVREYVQYPTFFLLHLTDIANRNSVPIRPFFARNLHANLGPFWADVNIEMLRIIIEFFYIFAALSFCMKSNFMSWKRFLAWSLK